MPDYNRQAIGRVQPIFKGEWESGVHYEKLDNVSYNGNTYVCIESITATQSPAAMPSYWTLVARKGDTGGIGTVIASASALETGNATASVVVSGDDPSARNFSFVFGLPKGDTGPIGIVTATASAQSLSAGTEPTVSIVLDSAAQSAHFSFGIPAADGQGIKLIDGLSADGSGAVNLTAVRYGIVQTELTEQDKAMARANINAMAAPSSIITGQFVQYDNGYKGATIYTIPMGDVAQVGRFLKKQSHTNTAADFVWADAHGIPAGGAAGALLTKANLGDYEVIWESAMTSADVDTIIGDDSSRPSA